MICDFCGGTTETRKVTKQHRLHGKLYIVENVQAEVCTGCGERYYHAKTLHALNALLGNKHKVRKRLQVEVVRVA
jgi:YgiT-type zinc finger domain-containing protein